MGPPGATGELELVPVATSVPSIAVLYRAEHVTMVRRLALMGSPVELAETIAHRAFTAIGRRWHELDDPLTAVRQLAVADVLSRYRPPNRAPTHSPSRTGAPPEWGIVAALLDPLAPVHRVARVLAVYDGLDDAAVEVVLPARRPRSVEPAGALPPADLHLATLFADAVSDITPFSRLTDLLGIRGAEPLHGEEPVAWRRRELRIRHLDRRWVGIAAVAVVVAGVFGAGFDAEIGLPAGPDQELRAGLSDRGGVVAATQGSPQSSCPAADPVIGPGGTPLPNEGDTEPRRVARMLATDRRAIVALNRGAVDARIIDRDGRVRRSGLPGTGRVRNIDGGSDDQIQVVISSAEHCPQAPEMWKGVPLVFTTLAAAEVQPAMVVAGSFADGTEWEVRDRPGHGLCASLGESEASCTTDADELERLAPVRRLDDASNRRIAFGYLPNGAATARLEATSGVLGPEAAVAEDGTFFVLTSTAEEEPERVRFFNTGGAAVEALPYPES